MRRDVLPVSAKRSTWAWCAARKRAGIKRSSGVPMASALLQPNMCSAAALNRTMRCSASTVMIASIARMDNGLEAGLVARQTGKAHRDGQSNNERDERTAQPHDLEQFPG